MCLSAKDKVTEVCKVTSELPIFKCTDNQLAKFTIESSLSGVSVISVNFLLLQTLLNCLFLFVQCQTCHQCLQFYMVNYEI